MLPKSLMFRRLHALVFAGSVLGAATASAQAPTPATPATICGQPVPPPAALPPTDIGPVVFQVAPCFLAQGNTSLVDINTYVYYMQIAGKTSRPSQGVWVPYNDAIEQLIRDDFKRLWATNFLDNLSIDVEDYQF